MLVYNIFRNTAAYSIGTRLCETLEKMVFSISRTREIKHSKRCIQNKFCTKTCSFFYLKSNMKNDCTHKFYTYYYNL